MKSEAVGLDVSSIESILCKSRTKSVGTFEKASLERYVSVFIYYMSNHCKIRNITKEILVKVLSLEKYSYAKNKSLNILESFLLSLYYCVWSYTTQILPPRKLQHFVVYLLLVGLMKGTPKGNQPFLDTTEDTTVYERGQYCIFFFTDKQ